MSVFNRYKQETVSNETFTPAAVDPTRQLYLTCATISNEAAALGSIAGWFARKGAGAAMDISNGFKKLTTFNWEPLPPLQPNAMAMYLSGKDYMEVESQMVSQPSGFSGNLGEYVTSLGPRVQLAAQLRTNVIKPASDLLGRYLSLAKERGDRRGFPPGASPIAEIGGLLAEEYKYFPGGTETTAEFGELFHSFSEFVSAERKMNEYALLINRESPTEVNKAVSQLSDIAGALFKSLAADNDPVSQELTVQIGHQLEAVARWVEWYALQITHLTETRNCFEHIEQQLR